MLQTTRMHASHVYILVFGLQVRQVVVIGTCPSGQFLCSDQVTCSVDGVCVSDLTSGNSTPAVTVNDAPIIQLINTTVRSLP
jgi:hypothetical protein